MIRYIAIVVLSLLASTLTAQETERRESPMFASAIFGTVSVQDDGKVDLALSITKHTPVEIEEPYAVTKVTKENGVQREVKMRKVNRMISKTEERKMSLPSQLVDYRVVLVNGQKIAREEFLEKLKQRKKRWPVIVVGADMTLNPIQLSVLKDTTVLLHLVPK